MIVGGGVLARKQTALLKPLTWIKIVTGKIEKSRNVASRSDVTELQSVGTVDSSP
jgi:hypothetical protein